jgi:hypothetical protein
LKIKKGYIYLTIIAIIIYSYLNHKDSKEKEHYSTIVNSMLTDIRREDYFKIHSRLPNELKSKISVDDIKKYCQSIKLDRKSNFELKKLDKNDENITIAGIITTKDKKEELHTVLKENNNSIVILSQQIGNQSLKLRNYLFL